MKERGKATGRLYELAQESGKKEALDEAMNQLQESMTDAESAQDAYEKLEQVYTEVLEEVVYEQNSDGKIDVREISNLYKQISFSANMAKEENYEVPVRIGNEVTSINLRIIHNSAESGRVTASMETVAFGKVMAQFRISAKGTEEYQMSGYVACDKADALEALGQAGEGLKKMLEQADIKIVSLNFIYNEALDLSTASQTAGKEETVTDTNDKNQEVSTKKLYETAKIFIGYIQER